MGFSSSSADEFDYDVMKERISEAARKQFRPEFINRFDDLIVFRMLNKPDIEKIVRLEVDKLIKRLADKQIQLKISTEVIDMIADKGCDPQYGARPIRRAIETLLEDPIAEAMLRGELTAGRSSQVTRPDALSSVVSFIEEPQPEPKPTKKAPKAPKATKTPKAPKASKAAKETKAPKAPAKSKGTRTKAPAKKKKKE